MMDETASKAKRIRASRGNKRRRPESMPESAGCTRNEMMDEAASKAERIRASRGNYEPEISFTGEAGLHQCLLMCDKNPGHHNFIPTNKFNIKHLPSRYQDNLLVDYVRATSDVTCRLSVSHISEDRPETWPDSRQTFPFSNVKGEKFEMVGTGWVSWVDKYTKGDRRYRGSCKCDECRSSHTPKKTWGGVGIKTANHVVFNTEEASHTKCQFFYDSPETDIDKVLTLTGLKVVNSNIKEDWCEMVYVTHDVELLDRFDKMYRRWYDLRKKVINKYMSYISPRQRCPGLGNVDHDLCIVVSHPHGCTKQISVGTWTKRQVVKKYVGLYEYITYSYNTPTCPGSSGAPTITLYNNVNVETARFFNLPAHSEGRPGNDNNSGVGMDGVFLLLLI